MRSRGQLGARLGYEQVIEQQRLLFYIEQQVREGAERILELAVQRRYLIRVVCHFIKLIRQLIHLSHV